MVGYYGCQPVIAIRRGGEANGRLATFSKVFL